MKYFISKWRELTSDSQILDIVEHCHIEFTDDIYPKQNNCPGRINFNITETGIIDREIKSLLKIGVIKEVQYKNDMYLSSIFIRPKKNGEYRMILNLKKLNEKVEYHHFKMDSFEKAVSLIKKNIYMSSVDLRHAYYSVHIAEEHQKFLCFKWGDKTYLLT